MSSHGPSTDDGRVVAFRPGRQPPRQPPPPTGASPVEDVGKYAGAGDEGPEEYRHRMAVNLAAFLFCVGLVIAGIWLAIKLADIRRDQDCVLSGRRNCAQVPVTGVDLKAPGN